MHTKCNSSFQKESGLRVKKNARERQWMLYRRDMLRVVKLFNPAGIKHRRHA